MVIWEADLGSAGWVWSVTSCKCRERQCWVKDTQTQTHYSKIESGRWSGLQPLVWFSNIDHEYIERIRLNLSLVCEKESKRNLISRGARIFRPINQSDRLQIIITEDIWDNIIIYCVFEKRETLLNMGCLGNSKTEDQRIDEKAQREANKKIEKQLQKERQAYKATHRLLLLGKTGMYNRYINNRWMCQQTSSRDMDISSSSSSWMDW